MHCIMIPNHKQFIEAIQEKHKVCLRFYSTADSGVMDLVCAALDYGPGAGFQDGVSRYWLWDYTSNTGVKLLGLLPEQVLDIRILGEVFDPAQFGATAPTWTIPRDWKAPAGAGTGIPAAGSAQSDKQPGSPKPSHLGKT
jgi:hypothetical protein